ncbi:hypothetical protein BTR23_14795 [Alkalihalophilus pseudofirmus]|nr:hypothetical protein BTR23_14795 [Alkalihalophilus pseudofirmus]
MNKHQVAEEVYKNYKNKGKLDFFCKRNINFDISTAYEIQRQVTEMKIKDNREKLMGYKISMTSEETQKPVNTNSPAYGTFTNVNIQSSSVQMDPQFSYLIEPELVFLITEDLSIGAGASEIINKSKVAPGLEIPTARYHDWFPPPTDINVADYIADNTCTGMLVYGEPVEIPTSMDWEGIKATLYFNDEKLDEGYSSSVWGNPVNAVCWLTEKLASENRSLKKGMIVSSGTFTLPKLVEKGMYHVDYDIFGMVSVKIE